MGNSRKNTTVDLTSVQTALFLDPTKNLLVDIERIYKGGDFEVGVAPHLSQNASGVRANTVAVVGVALGDEGKGRIVDNAIEEFLADKRVKKVVVVRYQGGNNAGHTIEKGEIKLALHVVPSFVMHSQGYGVMDRGVVIHPEDLVTEVTYIESAVGSITKRLMLSQDAILNTDLLRAEEMKNRILEGKSAGGTGRGISPSYAHHIDRLGFTIRDLLADDWKDVLGKQYERYTKEFAAFDLDLAKDIEVPDFGQTVQKKKSLTRHIGSKKVYLERLAEARAWLLMRNILGDTFAFHKKNYTDTSVAYAFEGAQAAGLDSWLGTRPDVTASNTRVDGVKEGTAFWQAQDIAKRVGIFKIPYTSSVGARRMPTHVELPGNSETQKLKLKTKNDVELTEDQEWALWVREEAHEYGTTTGRPRDITFLDLEFLRYNARMSGVNAFIGTHLDTALETQQIKVCTHYTDKKGKTIPYQPGLHYQRDVIPQYVSLPGWDGLACRDAQKKEDLPIHALKFLAFIEARTGFPILAVTTGPKREHYIKFQI
jgi:adenylosuccinate synthase